MRLSWPMRPLSDHPLAMTPPVHPFLLSTLLSEDNATPSNVEDWGRILADAAAHRLEPFLYQRLAALDLLHSLPSGCHKQLRRTMMDSAARNLLLRECLRVILGAFAHRGLRVVPLRGPALAKRLYGDAGDRPTDDLDLLVRRDDLPAVAAALRDLGFSEIERRQDFARTFSYYSLEFIHPEHGAVVEPHWTLAYPPLTDRLDMEAVWSRCVSRQIRGVPTWTLHPVDEVLHLCAHIAHRGDQAPLLWAYELDLLIRKEQEQLDWTELVRRARASGQGSLVGRVCVRLRALFATPIPDVVNAQLAAPDPDRAESWRGNAVDRLLLQSHLPAREQFAQFLRLERLGTKVRYASALLFPAPTYMQRRYGLTRRRQLPGAYLRRAGAIAWEGLRTLAAVTFAAGPLRR
ncbi:MAG: nucleotidyltransferase domain-containing protein [Nitrospiraceae bacterium]